MRPILPGLLTLIVAAAMLGCGAKTPTIPEDAEVYGVTIDGTGQPATHYKAWDDRGSVRFLRDCKEPGIYCPNCKHHVPVLQSDPTRASWLEQPPAAPPEPPAKVRLRLPPCPACCPCDGEPGPC